MDVKKAMCDVEIIPDVIVNAPGKVVKIKYPSGVSVNLGNELTPTQVKDRPTLDWQADPNKFYTVIMTDPDAPSRKEPTFREFKHWLMVNIPGQNLDHGEDITEYIGSGPPEGSGLHRYTFLVHEQPGKMDFSAVPKTSKRSREHRRSFSAMKFANEHKLGVPVAGNFYQAQYDDYCPMIHKQLSGE